MFFFRPCAAFSTSSEIKKVKKNDICKFKVAYQIVVASANLWV